MELAKKNPGRNDFFRRLGRTGFSDEDYEEALERLRRTIRRMEEALAERNWICGDRYTLVEICLIPTFQRLDDLGLQDLWQDYSNVTAWFDRVRERASFDEAYYPGSKFLDDAVPGI